MRAKAVPILPTETGLLYGYEQDEKAAETGEWVWWITARDWETRDGGWRVRAGAGGTVYDDFQGNTVGMDGRLYQGVIGNLLCSRMDTATTSRI